MNEVAEPRTYSLLGICSNCGYKQTLTFKFGSPIGRQECKRCGCMKSEPQRKP